LKKLWGICIFCNKCGVENTEDAKYCQECGSEINYSSNQSKIEGVKLDNKNLNKKSPLGAAALTL
jgi:uncharacterized membrane protein YvbJ